MHDIDRTQRELEMETESHEAEHENFLGALFGEAEHEAEHEHEHEHEHEVELEHEAESPLSESQEMELASELLEASNEAELEHFLGKLFSSAVRGVKNFAKSNVGRAIGGAVKGIAKKALPGLGTMAGGFLGGPLGAKIGGSLGNFASGLFELELEGLSHEDREFEVARQVVRLGAAAANRAARMPRSLPPVATARRAMSAAARVYAPGLVRRRGTCGTCGTASPGRGTFRQRRPRYGAPGYVRGANGTTRYVETGGVTEDVVEAEPVATAAAAPTGYPTRGGRWFRRGRHIVLTGL